MASPAVSTPSSAGSPAALAPAPPSLATKTTNGTSMSATSPVPGLPTPTIVTRKEWIVPPRPKPGRKPATDTPPTKRKAQNRAAQRAFRERRAARVGELEEQLEETKEEQQKREGEMREKIVRLEAEVLRFNGELQSWRLRCDSLDRIVVYERREKEAALAELSYLRNGSRTTGTDAVPLPPRRSRNQQSITPQERDFHPGHEQGLGLDCGNCTSPTQCACVDQAMAISTSGCGKCTDDHCQCLEETLKEAAADSPNQVELKRSHSPSAKDRVDKRRRHSLDPTTPLEVDFTAQFLSKAIVQEHLPRKLSPHLSPSHGESCGFCVEGTYCVCAEAAVVAKSSQEQSQDNRLPPLLNEVTPPPSDTDVDGNALKLPSMQPNQMHRPVAAPPSKSCVDGPGTCQQCQRDPKSGLFCRSLAAMQAFATPNSPTPDGCCGGNASGEGCCKDPPSVTSSQLPPSLSCADTYKTLSAHKNFDQASDELNTWLGRLHASPPHHAGRAPMEVEAASVMGVLKLFDRRFGRG